MAEEKAIVVKRYREKNPDKTFKAPVYFGTYANFITLKRPHGDNYESLQTYLEVLDEKINSGVVWNKFSS